MRSLIYTSAVSMLLMGLAACGGVGSSGSNGGSAPLEQAEVDRLALEDAIDLVLSEAFVECDEIFCPTADDSTPYVDGDIYSHICIYECVGVVDENGDLRQFYISFLWQRRDPACYQAETVDLWVVAEYDHLCAPERAAKADRGVMHEMEQL